MKLICNFRPLRRVAAPLLVMLLAGSGCQKAADVRPHALPAATEEGRNTIGCLIENQLWLANAGGPANSPVKASYATGAALEIEATHEGPIFGFSQLRLHLNAANVRPGTYGLDDGARLVFEDHEADDEDEYLAGGSTGDGSLTLTKVMPVAAIGNSAAYTILSGTYDFTAVSPQTGAVVHITDGRFDVKAY